MTAHMTAYAPLVWHSCDDHPGGHAIPIEAARSTPLGCGCTRHQGRACRRDVAWMEPACVGHGEQTPMGGAE